MLTYKVTATYTVFLEAEIEAPNETAAWNAAQNMDGSQFTKTHQDNWTINRVSQINQPKGDHHA